MMSSVKMDIMLSLKKQKKFRRAIQDREEAEKRLRQVEYFKHKKGNWFFQKYELWNFFNLEVQFLNNPNNNLSIIGRLFEADFGEETFTLFYENPCKLILTEVKGAEIGRIQKLSINIVELRPYLSWLTGKKKTS